jgi:acyl carrier protein
LVAYVVATPGSDLSTLELRSYLRHKLPEYMIPSVFVFLEALPLSPNGKVNRKALPASDTNRAELDQTFVAPRTPTEELLAGIWAEVLKVDKVGVYDNFFDLGGHSLLATQVVSRVRQTFHIEIALRSLFEHPTIGGLAEQIAETGPKMVGTEEIRNLLTELESLSDEETRR